MLMDVSKYLVTVGLVSGILAEGLHILSGSIMLIFAVASAITGYYIIPREEK